MYGDDSRYRELPYQYFMIEDLDIDFADGCERYLACRRNYSLRVNSEDGSTLFSLFLKFGKSVRKCIAKYFVKRDSRSITLSEELRADQILAVREARYLSLTSKLS